MKNQHFRSWCPLGVSKKLVKPMKNQHFCFWYQKSAFKTNTFQHYGFGGVLGVSWERLGPSWGVLAVSWGRLGPFWVVLGPTRCLKKPFKINENSTFLLLGPGATILGTKKVPLKPILFQHFGFGGVLGVSWGRLGPSWAVLGSSWAVWEASWAVLGASWAVFGPFGGPTQMCQNLSENV